VLILNFQSSVQLDGSTKVESPPWEAEGEVTERVDSRPEIALTGRAADTSTLRHPSNPAAAAWTLGVGNPTPSCAVAEVENKAPG